MKAIMMKTFATGIVATVFLLGSCKKGETGPAGSDGTNGTNGVVATSTDGFIKGNVSGTRRDGVAFNEAFDYQNYWSGPSGRLDSNSVANYDFSIIRGGGSIVSGNSAMITINTTSKSASSGNITLYGFSFYKSLGTNKWFEFNLTGSPSTTVTGLVYNTSTGLFTGNFSCTVPAVQNSTGNIATISGSFSATMVQIYNLIKETGTNAGIQN
jgi:hypothetical protein